MKCNTYVDLIPLYLLDELADQEKSAVKQHLDNCSSCQTEYQEMLKTIEACSENQPENLSEVEQLRLQNSIYRSVLANQTEPKKYSFPALTYITRTAAAILIFASGFVIASYNQTGDDGSQRRANYKTEMQLRGRSLQGFARTSAGLKVIAKGSSEYRSTQ